MISTDQSHECFWLKWWRFRWQSRWRSMNVNDSFISVGEIQWEKKCQKTFFYSTIVHTNCPSESKDWLYCITFQASHVSLTALSFTLSMKRCRKVLTIFEAYLLEENKSYASLSYFNKNLYFSIGQRHVM